jgi:hypothetical protein
MTSQTTTSNTEPLFSSGRTVRDVVEYSPELVNEVWCRKILRQILQALEVSYAKQQPHPTITADSIALQANGDAVLVSTATVFIKNPSEPDDLRALASVIHYAITQELAPQGPLRGRALEGYSDSLVGAIDRCMAPDLGKRPQNIEQLRSLLGIVSLGPPLPQKPSAPAFTPAPAAPPVAPAPPAPPVPAAAARPQAVQATDTAAAKAAALGRLQRWLMIGAAVSVLVAGGLALYTITQRDKAEDDVVLSLPRADSRAAAEPVAASAAPVPDAGSEIAPAPAADGAAAAPAPSEQLVTLPPEEAGAVQPAAGAGVPQAAPLPGEQAAQEAGTTYKLLIKPWATVYVNGVERGVSPPLKRLTLPAGEYTIRLVNPNYRDRVMKLTSGKKRSGSISHNFTSGSN